MAMKSVGKKLRELRLAKEWTLADLAQRSGVALSSLSRIETDKMTGTLESHLKIARALGVRLGELYVGLDAAGQPIELHRGTGISDQILAGKGASLSVLTSAALQKKMLPVAIHLQPGKSSQKEQVRPGVEKFIYLLKGKLEVTAGKEEVRMEPGDSLYLQAPLPYLMKNVGSSPALALRVTCPPTL